MSQSKPPKDSKPAPTPSSRGKWSPLKIVLVIGGAFLGLCVILPCGFVMVTAAIGKAVQQSPPIQPPAMPPSNLVTPTFDSLVLAPPSPEIEDLLGLGLSVKDFQKIPFLSPEPKITSVSNTPVYTWPDVSLYKQSHSVSLVGPLNNILLVRIRVYLSNDANIVKGREGMISALSLAQRANDAPVEALTDHQATIFAQWLSTNLKTGGEIIWGRVIIKLAAAKSMNNGSVEVNLAIYFDKEQDYAHAIQMTPEQIVAKNEKLDTILSSIRIQCLKEHQERLESRCDDLKRACFNEPEPSNAVHLADNVEVMVLKAHQPSQSITNLRSVFVRTSTQAALDKLIEEMDVVTINSAPWEQARPEAVVGVKFDNLLAKTNTFYPQVKRLANAEQPISANDSTDIKSLTARITAVQADWQTFAKNLQNYPKHLQNEEKVVTTMESWKIDLSNALTGTQTNE